MQISGNSFGGMQLDGLTPEQIRQKMMEKFDKDGDGKLSQSEVQDMLKEGQEKKDQLILDRYDKDGDGKLSEAEEEEMNNARNKNRGRLTREDVDLDGDGKISQSEIDIMVDGMETETLWGEQQKNENNSYNYFDGTGSLIDYLA